MIIPFRLTPAEAAGCLEEWCRKNRSRREARHLRGKYAGLQGCYLPYELIRGPVSCRVQRMDTARAYTCAGYVDNVFVSCSSGLDNRLLDGMEPYELDELQPFDFAYAAGQHIRIKDISQKSLQARVSQEVSDDYAPVVRKTLESKAVTVNTDPSSMLRLPVLLPVYYIRVGDSEAAVNGQTGKVSVYAEKMSHYYFIPWWIKAILATLVIGGTAFGAFRLFGMAMAESLYITGMLAFLILIITLAAYSDTVHNRFQVESERKILTSSGGPLRRIGTRLVREPRELRKEVTPPVFFEKLEGTLQPVSLVFSSPLRRAEMVLLALIALFLPVIIALFLNGFDFARLELGGSAVWFCITVPTVPIILLKFGFIELYNHPWIYLLGEDGSKKRYRKKSKKSRSGFDWSVVLGVLHVIFIPPASLAVWFGIAAFAVMCYLTAFGFD